MPIIAAACLALVGCAGAAEPTLAVCDGKHRRPANPNGSVLATATIALPAPSQDPKSVAAPIVKTPGPRAALDARCTRPCGAHA